MPKVPSPYELFGATSLVFWEKQIQNGRVPTGKELALILDANAQEALPSWFVDILGKYLRGELKQRPGRPKSSVLSAIHLEIAKYKYPHYLAWLQKRKRTQGLTGWPSIQEKDWWKGPPHERAARMVRHRWLRNVSLRTVLNLMSSQQ